MINKQQLFLKLELGLVSRGKAGDSTGTGSIDCTGNLARRQLAATAFCEWKGYISR